MPEAAALHSPQSIAPIYFATVGPIGSMHAYTVKKWSRSIQVNRLFLTVEVAIRTLTVRPARLGALAQELLLTIGRVRISGLCLVTISTRPPFTSVSFII